MLDIKITKTTHPKEKPQDESKLGFGKKFSDHMFLMDYTAGEGWHDARIVPYGPWEMDPATTVFHYAQEIFEGMKAYRTADGKIQLFRPDCNANRFNDSADRLGMPPHPAGGLRAGGQGAGRCGPRWVPHSDGASLYIRPFCIATDVGLGVHAAKHYRFAIICAPSGAYYAEGLDPVRIYVEDEYIRAAPGLTGFTKCGGNYARPSRPASWPRSAASPRCCGWTALRRVRRGSRLHEHHVQDRRRDLHRPLRGHRFCPASPAAPSSSC